MQIALYQPDIPQNVGSILRLCACMDVACHIIEPCGFILDDKRLARVAMDYAQHVRLLRHSSWERFLAQAREQNWRVILFTTKGASDYCDFTFKASDVLLLGRESAGVPPAVADAADARLRIPIAPHARSLNVATAAAMALGEGLRQTRPQEARHNML
jgi:tRNA (cytidine/uridine-2'-O-)-methyltransferase